VGRLFGAGTLVTDFGILLPIAQQTLKFL